MGNETAGVDSGRTGDDDGRVIFDMVCDNPGVE